MTMRTVLLLDATTRAAPAGAAALDDSVETRRERRLVCRGCRFGITDESQRVPVDGEHVHTRQNPAGMRFCFGCFGSAPGCSVQGTATAEYSWFAGCRWRIALCGGCGAHLGWSFEGARTFFGLILSRISSAGQPSH